MVDAALGARAPESGWWLGPTVSIAHEAADVDRYLGVFAEFVGEVSIGG
jgi:hypothetical protein